MQSRPTYPCRPGRIDDTLFEANSSARARRLGSIGLNYIPIPIPPMSPPGIGGIAALSSGFSATIASVVMRRPATRPRLQRVARPWRIDSSARRSSCRSLGELADDDRTVDTGVLGNLLDRYDNRALHDLDTDTLIVVVRVNFIERLDRLRAARNRHPGRCLPRPQRGSRAWRLRRGLCAPSLRSRWHHRHGSLQHRRRVSQDALAASRDRSRRWFLRSVRGSG